MFIKKIFTAALKAMILNKNKLFRSKEFFVWQPQETRLKLSKLYSKIEVKIMMKNRVLLTLKINKKTKKKVKEDFSQLLQEKFNLKIRERWGTSGQPYLILGNLQSLNLKRKFCIVKNNIFQHCCKHS
jgi:hypothetical protein